MDSIIKLSLVIFCLPIVSFVLLAFFNRKLPRNGDYIGIASLGAAFVCAMIIFFRAMFGSEPLFAHWTFDWLPTTAHSTIKGGVLVDGLTAVMLVVVTLVSFLVHLFSSAYMHGDVRYGRYYAALSLFTMSMLGIVLADNLLYLFVFWELVGLSSYVLIGHWFEKKSASDAAIKAFITTRVGDVGMLIGLLIVYWKVGSLQYVDVFAASGAGGLMTDEIMIPGLGLRASWQTLAALGLFFGAMGKSAQFPLHVWLPDAMEGPTPVSALIHAATMVAAGVYLVGRLYPIFTPEAFLCVAYIGGITAIFAASIAVVQDDIKKVLAYSTLSQLGYMMMSLGVGGFVVMGYYAGLFHLTTHAFFKAGLFLGSGSVIHAMHHEQSLSKYGGLWKKIPVTHWTYFCCVLAIIGFPFTSGYQSKDRILGATLQFAMDHPAHWLLPLIGFSTALLTAFYMFRQYFLTFWGEPRDHHAYDHAHEGPWAMKFPLMLLGALALVAGGVFFGGWFEKIAPPPDRVTILANYKHYHEAHGQPAGGQVTIDALAKLEHAAPVHAEEHATEHVDAASGHTEEHAHEGHLGVGGWAHGVALALSIIVAGIGVMIAAITYLPKHGVTIIQPALVARRVRPLYNLLLHKYYFDEMYGFIFLGGTHVLIKFMAAFDRIVIDGIVNFVGLLGVVAAFVTRLFDNWVVDGAVNGAALMASTSGEGLAVAQSGKIRHYLLFIGVGVLIVTGIVFFVA